jgi:hypothetical protein
LGFCSKWTLFKKITYLKRTNLIKVKKNKIRIITFVEKEIIIISITAKKVEIKLIDEKEYLTTKINLKGRNVKKA